MKQFLFATLMLLVLGMSGTTNAQTQRKQKPVATKTVVEVLYFHSKQRCPTCIAIGKNSIDVVNRFFAQQVRSGQVKFKEIDISTPTGEKIADRYCVTWSSLYVNQWKNGREQRNDMTRFGFENARSNENAFRTGLKNKISQLLK